MAARLSLAVFLICTPALVAQTAFHSGVRFAGLTAGSHPAVFAVDGNGNTFVVCYFFDELGNQRLLVDKSDASGNPLGSFPLEDHNAYAVAGAAVDPSGNLVIVGSTSNSALLTPANDTFVTRIDSQLKTTLSSITLGATQSLGTTQPMALALDQKGNIYITGQTDGAGFAATPGAFQTGPLQGGASYAFLTEVAADGKTVVFSTFFGDPSTACAPAAYKCLSPAYTAGTAIALDRSGEIAITGYTDGNHLPVTAGAFSATCGDCGTTPDTDEAFSGFIAKFSADGSKLLASSYIPVSVPGGSVGCTLLQPTGLLFDSAGNMVMAGFSFNAVLPVTAGALQPALPGSPSDGDGFVLKLDPTAGHLLFGTYFGGFEVSQSNPSVYGLAPGGVAEMVQDGQGLLWLTGASPSNQLPVPAGTPFFGDAYLAALSPDGASLAAIFTAPLGVAGSAIAATASGITALGSADGLLTASGGAGPSLVAVENAAGSVVSGAVAPSELISLYGSGIGSSNVDVLFDGVAAPVLYTSPTQVNAIVPKGVAGQASTTLGIRSPSGMVASVVLQISPSQPGVVLSAGQPQPLSLPYAAALNQDGTVNSAVNPAAFGTVVSVWVSGAGLSTIPVPDATIRTSNELGAPVLPVIAFAKQDVLLGLFGLAGAVAGPLSTQVVFAGDAPGMVSGVTQVNFLVPAGLQSESAGGIEFVSGSYEFWIQIGDARSESFTLYLR